MVVRFLGVIQRLVIKRGGPLPVWLLRSVKTEKRFLINFFLNLVWARVKMIVDKLRENAFQNYESVDE